MINTDILFLQETKNLISTSRKIALELGYDYISTFHLFLADCELNSSTSLMKFAFDSEDSFRAFKETSKAELEYQFDLADDSLPLTEEAETAIRQSDTCRIVCKQSNIYPWHIFIEALKVKDSLFIQCFEEGFEIVGKLIDYYDDLHVFDLHKLSDNEIQSQYYIPRLSDKPGVFRPISELLKRV